MSREIRPPGSLVILIVAASVILSAAKNLLFAILLSHRDGDFDSLVILIVVALSLLM